MVKCAWNTQENYCLNWLWGIYIYIYIYNIYCIFYLMVFQGYIRSILGQEEKGFVKRCLQVRLRL
jgi:hypothetical protein